jgi:hypothetical protein
MGKNCDIFLNVTEQLVLDFGFLVTNMGWNREYTSSAHKNTNRFSQFITLYQCPEGTQLGSHTSALFDSIQNSYMK